MMMDNEPKVGQGKNEPLSTLRLLIRMWNERRHILLVMLLLILLGLFLSLLPPGMLAVLWARLIARRALAVFLVLFGLVALSLLWAAGQEFDAWLFLSFNARGKRARWLDWFMAGVTQIGNGAFAFGLAGLFNWTGQRRQAVVLVLGTLTLWLVVETFKAITGRPRPGTRFAETRIVGWRERGKSFPSGHTSQTFFLISLLVHFFQLPPGISVLLYGLAVVVGFTRIYVGAHYPRDVLAGALLGQVWGILSVLVGS
jgi:membrane-associated phospholipid phosphatase